MSERPKVLVVLSAIALAAGLGTAPDVRAELDGKLRPALGTPAPADYRSSISPDGTGLPSSSARVADGEALYERHCASCHGADGRLAGNALVGGIGSLATDAPLKTVGSFWPFATTLYDYIGRAMPYGAAGSLTDEERYAVTGWVLHLNGLIEADAVLDAQTLVALRMPNRDGFVPLWPDPPESETYQEQ